MVLLLCHTLVLLNIIHQFKNQKAKLETGSSNFEFRLTTHNLLLTTSMKIALIGYGKMGKAIEEIALAKGHEAILKIDISNQHEFTAENLSNADVAIEFTGPHSAVDNLKKLFDAGIPVVSGSTGWLEQWNEIKEYCEKKNGAFIYASNFSIGVNLFFELNTFLAKLMSNHPEYDVTLDEIHHTQKKDAPSGTAITLAEQVLQHIKSKKQWVNEPSNDKTDLLITSQRIDPAPGTHSIKYHSAIDDIEIIHTAHNRKGFAGGAVAAAEFIAGKKGIYTMKDVLGL
jgi:4-hydroxy-tetrahydrodipicolinate reductase